MPSMTRDGAVRVDLTLLFTTCNFWHMASHDEILAAAQRLCASRGEWRFKPDEIVRALPHLNAGTVRTHVTSRCCVNAPRNHPHKWDYFRRVGRALYEITPAYRPKRAASHSVVREATARYGAGGAAGPGRRHVVHAVVARGGGWFTAECLEIAVVTQGRTLDETVASLRDAVALHLEGEDPGAFGLAAPLALSVTFEASIWT